jgi:uncharacterized membrane protein
MIDKLTEKIFAIGIPMLLLVVIKFLTGNNGASAFTDGMEDLGFGFGMMGGVLFLIILALLIETIIRYLFERKFNNIIKKMQSENHSRTEIIVCISKKILYSKDLKNRALVQLALRED